MDVLVHFLDRGLEVNDSSTQLLALAVHYQSIDIIATLLDRGANPHIKPDWPSSSLWPLEIALSHDYTSIAGLLLSTNYQTPLEEISALLTSVSLYGSFSSFRQAVNGCFGGDLLSCSKIAEVWGAGAPAGLLILLNRFGCECLRWIIDENIPLGLLAAYFEGRHAILTDPYIRTAEYVHHRPSSQFVYGNGVSRTVIVFDSRTDILQELLAYGVYPGLGLLKLCACSCSAYSVNNVRLILERRGTLRQSVSSSLVTDVLAETLKHLQAKHRGDLPWYNRERTAPECWQDHLRVLKFLTEQGAVVEDAWQSSLLKSESFEPSSLAWLAAFEMGLSTIKHLIQSGADIDERTSINGLEWFSERTPLMVALENGEIEIASLSLREGANVNSVVGSGWTALKIGVKKGYFQVVLGLLRAGVNINTRPAMALHL